MFCGCSSLASITIPDSVTSIGGGAFYGCSKLTDITIPNSVTSIGDTAFGDCRSLTSVTIPNSVTNIGISPFRSCTSLTDITVDSANENYSSIDGVLFNKEKTMLIQFPNGNEKTSYTIPDGVTGIGAFAFEDCSNLTSVTIPDTITNIGDYAFFGFASLTSITIPRSVTSIGEDAFERCNSLTSITISNSVTSIERSTFSECSSLKSIDIPDSVISIGEYAFLFCTSLESVTIGNSVTNIGADAFYDCSKLTDVYYTGSEEDWNNITIDNDNDPLLNATIHYNWTGEAPNPQTVKDESGGIEISAPFGAYEGTLELEFEEVFDGESYNVVSTIDGAAQNKVYDITTKVNGEPAQPGKAVTVRIPLPEGYDPDRTYVYHVNSETGEVENMNARYEDGCLVFETDHFSVYAVVEMEEERSFFGKVIDVLLGIVSLPVKLIVGLFKLIIGLFI